MDQVTPKETWPVPKMAAWCEGKHPPQSQRTMEPSGGEGKASNTAAAVTTRSAAMSVALGGLVTSLPVTMATCAIPVNTATAAMPVISSEQKDNGALCVCCCGCVSIQPVLWNGWLPGVKENILLSAKGQWSLLVEKGRPVLQLLLLLPGQLHVQSQ